MILERFEAPLYSLGIFSIRLFVHTTVRLQSFGLQNIPEQGPAILVANHVSYLDPIVIFVLANRRGRRVRAVAVEALFKRPVIGAILNATGQIPATAEGGSVLREAKRALARADLVLIYPEGTIPTGEPIRPRRGAAVLAAETGAPIIPILTKGLERRAFNWTRREATAYIGAPIMPPSTLLGQGALSYAEITDLLMSAIRHAGNVSDT